jgi:hypothetical protein
MKRFLTTNFENGYSFQYDNLWYNKIYRNGSYYEPVIYPDGDNRIMSDEFSIEAAVNLVRSKLQNKSSIELKVEPDPGLIKTLYKELSVYNNRIKLYFDISSSDDNSLQFWEPGSASFTQRFESLRCAHAFGFRTIVFCVPFYDETVFNLIEQLTPFVSQFMEINTPLPFIDLLNKDIELNVSLKDKLLHLQSLCTEDFLDNLEECASNNSIASFSRNYIFPYFLKKNESLDELIINVDSSEHE